MMSGKSENTSLPDQLSVHQVKEELDNRWVEKIVWYLDLVTTAGKVGRLLSAWKCWKRSRWPTLSLFSKTGNDDFPNLVWTISKGKHAYTSFLRWWMNEWFIGNIIHLFVYVYTLHKIVYFYYVTSSFQLDDNCVFILSETMAGRSSSNLGARPIVWIYGNLRPGTIKFDWIGRKRK